MPRILNLCLTIARTTPLTTINETRKMIKNNNNSINNDDDKNTKIEGNTSKKHYYYYLIHILLAIIIIITIHLLFRCFSYNNGFFVFDEKKNKYPINMHPGTPN